MEPPIPTEDGKPPEDRRREQPKATDRVERAGEQRQHHDGERRDKPRPGDAARAATASSTT